MLNQSCIYWDGFHPEELKRLDEEVAESWKDKYWVKEGDVLINSTGKGTLGRALEWTKESNTHTLDSHITRVHPDESVLDPTYFRFYLESSHGQKMLYAFCVAGSTGQIELSKTDLQTMPVLLPPIDEQKNISEAFHRVNRKLQKEQKNKKRASKTSTWLDARPAHRGCTSDFGELRCPTSTVRPNAPLSRPYKHLDGEFVTSNKRYGRTPAIRNRRPSLSHASEMLLNI